MLQVPRNAVIEKPIEITHEGTDGAASHPRTLILVGANAQCTIVETYQGGGHVLHQRRHRNRRRRIAPWWIITRSSRKAVSAFHVATLQAALGRSAAFSSHSISLGGALVRNDANCVLSEGSDATLNGLYIVNGTQHIDNHTAIDHAKPHATSHELYKGILDGKSHAVFNGKIIVRKDAQKTDSKQTNKNLVLSDDAVIDTKPELQICADDVRCTHGATIGQLDSESPLLPAIARHRQDGGAQPADLRLRAGHRGSHQSAVAYGIRWNESCSRNSMSTLTSAVSAPLSTWKRIREDFPVLKQNIHGKPLVYLDSAATAQKPLAVIDAIRRFHEVDCANIHRGVHELSPALHRGLRRDPRQGASDFSTRASKEELIFVRGTTEGINLVTQPGAAERQGRATRSSSRPWSTTPTSCPGRCSARRRARRCASSP